MHGAGDADISQTALFLQTAAFIQRHLAGKHAFFHPDDKHLWKLQPLGRVQGHQLHRILIRIRLPLARFQRSMGKKGLQRHQILIFFLITELARCRHQLLQVFHPGLSFLAFLLLVHAPQAGIAYRPVGLNMQRQIGGIGGQRIHQFQKTLQCRRRTPGQHFFLQQRSGRLPERQLTIARRLAHHIQRAIADTARRRIDHPLKRCVIIAVGDQPQIRKRIFDFLPLEETHAAIDSIWQILLQQRLFQHARLSIAAIKNGAFDQCAARVLPHFDAINDETRFIKLVERAIQGDRLAFHAVRPQVLAETIAVMGDQRIRGVEDSRGGSVILLQTDGFHLLKITQEMLNVLNLRAAPTINGLIIIADDHHPGAVAGQQPDPGILNAVGILKFVHQDVGEPITVMLQDMGFIQPQLMGAQQQLSKIHQPGSVAGFLISLINAQPGLLDRVAIAVDMVWPQPLVFLAVDVPHRLTRRPLFLVQIQCFDQPLKQPQLIFAVQNLEILRQSRIQMMRAQQTMC